MSLRVTVKSPNTANILKKLRSQLHSSEFVQQVQSEVVEGTIKKLIRSGQSPVEGFGRFVQYKDKDSYPGGQKPVTPANLTLSGSMLRFYAARRKSLMSMTFGIISEAGEEIKIKAKANNEGTLALQGKKLDKAARAKVKESNLPLNRASRGGKRKRTLQEVASANSGIPARRFIPINKESYSISVIRKLKNLYTKQIKKILSK